MALPQPAANGSDFQREKAELEAVLTSGIFARAPSLERFLLYICERHFAGQADQIKEYNIAVEALGRGPDFDQKKDAIVRVEAHRLRKRLKDYYAAEGANHEIRIVVPQGQYIPQFVVEDGQSPEASLENGSGTGADEGSKPAGRKGSGGRLVRWPVAVAAAAALLALVFAVASWRGRMSLKSSTAGTANDGALPAAIQPVVPPGSGEIRILAGWQGQNYVDAGGKTWLSDRFFSGGREVASPDARVVLTRDPAMFRFRREGEFRYDIPLKPGVYELRLYFAETTFGPGNIAGGGETSRLFNVFANDKPLLNQFDIIADAGGNNAADIRVFKDISPAADGYLHLRFTGFKETAVLSGLEVVPGTPGRLQPIRILAANNAYTDKQGRLWEPDRYFSGGQTVSRSKLVSGTPDPEVYLGERFGNFSYVIPVAEGRYTLTLKFAETWFSPSKPSGQGAGARLFDVYCNGVALLRNFDIFKEAGGEDRAVDKVFRGLHANAQGKLIVSFVPVRNYACINAIEVVDESR
jgi:hypothetical protein